MSTADGVEITGPMGDRLDEVLTPRSPGHGQQVTEDLVERVLEEMGTIRDARGDAFASGRWDDARALFTEMALADSYPDFFTVPAYERMP